VRSLLILVLALAGGMGWIVNRARTQRDVVAAIQKARGQVWYEWEWKSGVLIPNGKPWWPRWLIDLVGVDYFGNVAYVELDQNGSDAELSQIGRLKQLKGLRLTDPFFVTDAGLAQLDGLTNLKYLYLQGEHVTNAWMPHFKGLSELRGLVLSFTAVDDAGLGNLKDLINLQHLGLEATGVTDSGLGNLKGLINLKTLGLGATGVTASGVQELQRALPRARILQP
jgi:hypothetical protein